MFKFGLLIVMRSILKYVLTVFFLQSLFFSFSQESPRTDSLNIALAACSEDSCRIRVLTLLIKGRIDLRETKKCREDLTLLKSISEKSGNKKGLGQYYLLNGKVQYYQGDLKEAKQSLREASDIFKSTDDFDSYIQSNYSYGMVEFSTGNSQEALRIYKGAAAQADKVKDKKILGNIYGNLSTILISMQKTDEGTKYLKLAEDVAVRYNRRGLINVYTCYSNIYFSKALYQEALKYMFKTLQIAEQYHELYGMTVTYNNIASSYLNLGNLNEAYKYSLLAMECSKKAGDKLMFASVHLNLGNIFGMRRQFDSAYWYFSRAYELSTPILDRKDMAASSERLGDVIIDRDKDYNAGLERYMQAFRIYEEMNNPLAMARMKLSIGRALLGKKDLKEAEKNLYEALQTLQKMNSGPDILICYGLLSQLKEAQKDYREALRYEKLNKRFSDSILTKQNSANLNQAQLQYEFTKKEELANAENEKQKELAEAEIKRQQTLRYAFTGGFALVLLFSVVVYRSLRLNVKKSEIISRQKEIVEEKQKEILDSITYAKRIQDALLTNKDFISTHFPENFILFMPKDIVSGDFYWAASVVPGSSFLVSGLEPVNTGKQKIINQEHFEAELQNRETRNEELFYLAVCDSTGHGVPGAFMSLLNIGFLSEAIKEKNITDPGKVFDYTRNRLISSISAEGQKDGFDGTLLCINKQKKEILYTAAHNAPLLFSQGVLKDLEADKMPVGKGEMQNPFSTYTINYSKGDFLYLYTDGYADQFGGDKGKKFKYKQLDEVLSSVSGLPSEQQKEILEKKFREWKGNLEQVDDVCVIGIRL
jgi:serine phosphatase RsbU (regulator of sigma subunit)